MKTVHILGTEYIIRYATYDEYPNFKEEGLDGWCSTVAPEIVIGDLKTFPSFQQETPADLAVLQKRALRHEIVHGFLFESGLDVNSNPCDSWGTNEEMVDWIAIQGEKIYKAWEEAGAL